MANIKTKDRLDKMESLLEKLVSGISAGMVPAVQRTEVKADASKLIPEGIRAKMEPSSPGSDFLRVTSQGFTALKGTLVYVMPGGKKDKYFSCKDAASRAILKGTLEKALEHLKRSEEHTSEL